MVVGHKLVMFGHVFRKYCSKNPIQLKRYEFDGTEIPFDAIGKRYMRSSGAGGQNVNMVNSKCQIYFNINEAKWISDELSVKFCEKFPRFVGKSSQVVISSDKHRTGTQNLDECFRKLCESLNLSANELKIQNRIHTDSDLQILRQRMERGKEHRLQDKRRDTYNKIHRKCDV